MEYIADMTKDSQEIELKLRLPEPHIAERILQDSYLNSLSKEEPRTKSYETIYYDTKDQDLLREGICYRIRQGTGQYEATIKGKGHSQGGLSQRLEWNRPLKTNTPNLEDFRDIPLVKDILKKIGDKKLKPVFSTIFQRQILKLHYEESIVELALDMGEIKAGEKTEAICELELELKKGQVGAVLAIGKKVAQEYNLQPANLSKFSRGLILAGFGKEVEAWDIT